MDENVKETNEEAPVTVVDDTGGASDEEPELFIDESINETEGQTESGNPAPENRQQEKESENIPINQQQNMESQALRNQQPEMETNPALEAKQQDKTKDNEQNNNEQIQNKNERRTVKAKRKSGPMGRQGAKNNKTTPIFVDVGKRERQPWEHDRAKIKALKTKNFKKESPVNSPEITTTTRNAGKTGADGVAYSTRRRVASAASAAAASAAAATPEQPIQSSPTRQLTIRHKLTSNLNPSKPSWKLDDNCTLTSTRADRIILHGYLDAEVLQRVLVKPNLPDNAKSTVQKWVEQIKITDEMFIQNGTAEAAAVNKRSPLARVLREKDRERKINDPRFRKMIIKGQITMKS
ncbi:MAG: hypothetical protein VX367_10545, partial [SAR324 cluster bacterium]|nr:hypothetical protein [SAR324 cluster bacterium]